MSGGENGRSPKDKWAQSSYFFNVPASFCFFFFSDSCVALLGPSTALKIVSIQARLCINAMLLQEEVHLSEVILYKDQWVNPRCVDRIWQDVLSALCRHKMLLLIKAVFCQSICYAWPCTLELCHHFSLMLEYSVVLPVHIKNPCAHYHLILYVWFTLLPLIYCCQLLVLVSCRCTAI